MALLIYTCRRKGLPSPEDQRASIDMVSTGEVAGVYADDCTRKRKPDEPAQPERDHMVGAARGGDEVWVSRPGVIATTDAEALRFAARISKHGAVLRIASTGGSYSVLPAMADALLLVAAIREDERAATLEKARKGIKGGKPAGKPKISQERLEAAKPVWFNHELDGIEAARITGVGKRTLHSYFGKRGTPAFGRALNIRRGRT